MNRRFFSIILSAALCLTALSACGGTQSQAPEGDLLAAIQAKGEIVVATEGTWAPWCYHDESGALVGYDVEVAQAIAEKLGVTASFVEGEFDGLLAGLEAGRYDVMVNGVDITEERAEKYNFCAPYDF